MSLLGHVECGWCPIHRHALDALGVAVETLSLSDCMRQEVGAKVRELGALELWNVFDSSRPRS